MSNCVVAEGGLPIVRAASGRAVRASGLHAAAALTRLARWASGLSCDRHDVPADRAIDPRLSRSMALRMVMILRMTATMTTLAFFPAAARRSWKALSSGLQRQAISAAMYVSLLWLLGGLH